MSRKHYRQVADVIKWEMDHLPDDVNDKIVARDTVLRMAHELADIFQRDNGGFDRQRFLEACGL